MGGADAQAAAASAREMITAKETERMRNSPRGRTLLLTRPSCQPRSAQQLEQASLCQV